MMIIIKAFILVRTRVTTTIITTLMMMTRTIIMAILSKYDDGNNMIMIIMTMIMLTIIKFDFNEHYKIEMLQSNILAPYCIRNYNADFEYMNLK